MSLFIVGATLTVVAFTADTAHAQRPGQNGQDGQGRQGGYGRQGGWRGMGQRRPLTLATIPVAAMTSYFGLTEEQEAKITELQKTARPDMSDMRSTFESFRNQQENLTPEQRREQGIAMGRKIQERMAKAEVEQERVAAEIGRVLTGEQRPQIASFLRDADLFAKAELPLELIKPLDLDGPQKRKLQNVVQDNETARAEQMRTAFQKMREGRRNDNNGDGGDNNRRPDFGAMQETFKTVREALRAKVVPILTADQKAILEKWDKEHPNQGFGFPGGVPGGGPAIFLGGPGAGGN